jgi:alkylation response protein AidB-like acyl-CoA dehydrogenase
VLDTRLTEEQQQLRKTVEAFARDVVAPVAAHHDETKTFPYDVVRQMGEMGLFGLPFPEEHGGMGGDYFALCLVLEELARVDQSVAITLEAAVSLGAMPVYRFGTEEQKAQWLPQLCSGEALGAFGLTEAGAGSDAGGTRTTARLDGGEWVINGSKAFITNSGTELTQLVTVTAVTGRPPAEEGDQLDPGAGPDRGLHRRAGVRQGRLARLRHPPADLRRRPRAGGEPARRARSRLRQLPAHPGRGPHRHLRAGRRCGRRAASTRA